MGEGAIIVEDNRSGIFSTASPSIADQDSSLQATIPRNLGYYSMSAVS